MASALPVLQVQPLFCRQAAGLAAETQSSALKLRAPHSHLEAPESAGCRPRPGLSTVAPGASNKSQPQPQPRTSLWGPPLRSSFRDPRAHSAPGSAASPAVNPGSVGTSWEHSFLAVKMETVAKDTSPGEHKKRKKQRVRTPSAEKGEGQQPPPDSARNRRRFPAQAASLSHVVLPPPSCSEAANGPPAEHIPCVYKCSRADCCTTGFLKSSHFKDRGRDLYLWVPDTKPPSCKSEGQEQAAPSHFTTAPPSPLAASIQSA